MSMMTWVRDYLYTTIGGRSRSHLVRIRAIVLSFVLIGLWHGAAWHFVLFGLLHGTGVAWSTLGQPGRRFRAPKTPGGESTVPRAATVGRILRTLAFLYVSLILFRSEDLAGAWLMLTAVVRDLFNISAYIAALIEGQNVAGHALWLIAVVSLVEWLRRDAEHPLSVLSWPRWARWSLYSLLYWMIVYYGSRNVTESFIYFQF